MLSAPSEADKGWIIGSYPSYYGEGKGERPPPMLHSKSDSLPAGLLLTTGAEKRRCPECQDLCVVKHIQPWSSNKLSQ